MRTVKALKNQSLIDIAMQELGSATGVFQLAKLNNISLTAALTPGMDIIVSETAIDAERLNYYQTNTIKPATEASDIPCLFDGIGYMKIESSFIVGKSCSHGIGSDRIEHNFIIA